MASHAIVLLRTSGRRCVPVALLIHTSSSHTWIWKQSDHPTLTSLPSASEVQSTRSYKHLNEAYKYIKYIYMRLIHMNNIVTSNVLYLLELFYCLINGHWFETPSGGLFIHKCTYIPVLLIRINCRRIDRTKPMPASNSHMLWAYLQIGCSLW